MEFNPFHGFRSGILNLVTNADQASWQLLANTAAEQGVRSVTMQMSQHLRTNNQDSLANTSVTTRLALTQLAGNDSTADWMFPRTRPEHHRSVPQLISEWERQTDGELRRLLPLRLARELRNWRPTMVVIESMSDDDMVAGIFADALERAIEIAELDEHAATAADQDLVAAAESLAALGLSPWRIQRIVRRVPSDRQSSPSYDDNDLLPSIGTTAGLLCDAALRVLTEDARTRSRVRGRSSYEVVMDRNNAAGVTNLLQGLDATSLKGARRSVQHRSGDELKQLQQVLEKSRIEGSALQGHAKLARAEESLTAELRNVGQGSAAGTSRQATKRSRRFESAAEQHGRLYRRAAGNHPPLSADGRWPTGCRDVVSLLFVRGNSLLPKSFTERFAVRSRRCQSFHRFCLRQRRVNDFNRQHH
jgi:hypothetical protein